MFWAPTSFECEKKISGEKIFVAGSEKFSAEKKISGEKIFVAGSEKNFRLRKKSAAGKIVAPKFEKIF